MSEVVIRPGLMFGSLEAFIIVAFDASTIYCMFSFVMTVSIFPLIEVTVPRTPFLGLGEPARSVLCLISTLGELVELFARALGPLDKNIAEAINGITNKFVIVDCFDICDYEYFVALVSQAQHFSKKH